MKIGKNAKANNDNVYSKPAKNQSKKNLLIIAVVVITAGMIVWVYSMGQKAEQTVQVVMLKQPIYKNEVVTEDMLEPYDMLKGEYEKYAVTDQNGQSARKVVLWSEKDKVINTFAAYPLEEGTYAYYRDFIKSRIDNSDNVLYSYPGKEIVPLEIGSDDLNAFKSYLQPGDALDVEAIFSEDSNNGSTGEKSQLFKTETIFKDIMMADLLNSEGQSILDIYTQYNNASVYEQAQMENSESFKKSVEPKTILVALTPEEKERYYYYLSKSNIQFRVSMPQRSN